MPHTEPANMALSLPDGTAIEGDGAQTLGMCGLGLGATVVHLTDTNEVRVVIYVYVYSCARVVPASSFSPLPLPCRYWPTSSLTPAGSLRLSLGLPVYLSICLSA